MSKNPSRFDKYKDKFKPDVPKEPVKSAHLGETLVMDIGHVVDKRLQEILPFFIPSAKRGDIEIRTSNTSFWDMPDKYLVMTVFIRFDKDVVWKDQQSENSVDADRQVDSSS